MKKNIFFKISKFSKFLKKWFIGFLDPQHIYNIIFNSNIDNQSRDL